MRRIPPRKIEIIWGTAPPEPFLQSAEAAARLNGVVQHHEFDASVGLLDGADHAAALDAAELHGLEVDHDQQGLSDKLLRGIPLGNAGNDLPFADSVKQTETEQLI